MSSATDGIEEDKRLASLRRYNMLDTASDSSFDQVAALAAYICGTPISLMTLVEEDRQRIKSRFGWNERESNRVTSFCAHAIQQHDVFVVEDASLDERFQDNPLVNGEPGIRFYAGTPLVDADGQNIGTLCAIDRNPAV